MTSDATPPEGRSARADDMIGRLKIAPGDRPANDTVASAAQQDSQSRTNEAAKPARLPGDEPAARKRKRSRDGVVVGYLSGVFTFLTLVVLALAGAAYYGKSLFDGPGPLAADTTVLISRNQGVTEIADSLQRAGVIEQPFLFKAGVQIYGVKDRLRYGEYAFPANVSMRDALAIITSGKSIEHSVTIPEGLTSLQIVERLRDQPLLSGEIRETPPEGALLPETYNFTRGAAREQILDRMKQHRDKALDEIWAERDPSVRVKTKEELVILASLVEKETGIAAERPQVAAVFANRLVRGMRLQSDPTIVYGIVGGRGTLGRSLTRKDIQSQTPYNTYVVQGLPAGPIANPGRRALEAAAKPAKTSDLYFVADGSGGHAFAPSLVEHNKNVGRWRQIEKARGVPADRLAPDEQTPEATNEAAADEATGATPAAPGGAAAPAAASSSSSSGPKPKPGAAAAGQPAPRQKPANERRRPREQ